MSLGFAPYLSRLFVPRLVWKSCTNIRICLRFKAIVGCQCRTSCQSWKVCRKQDSLQFPKGVFKNVFVLVVVGTIVYSACTTDPDIAWCSDWPLHINCLSSETQVEKSLENSRITGNGARIFAKAKKLTEKGNLSAAEELYQQLIQEEPTFAPAYGNLANIQVASGKYSQAINNYSRAIQLAPSSDDAWIVYLNRANTWIALGDYKKAMEDVEQAIQRKPKDPLILSTRALLLSYEGNWDAAFIEYQNAIDSRPNQVEPFWFNYGMLLFEKGKSFEGRTIIYRVAQKFPKQSDIHAALAGIEYARGDIQTAESQWKLVEYPEKYTLNYIKNEKKWPPKVKQALESFITACHS